MHNSITGNKGKWSEIYVLLRLLGDGKIYAADENVKKLGKIYFPILKIIREEIATKKHEYVVKDTNFIVAYLDYDACDNFEFPQPQESRKGVNDILNCGEKHSDIYYYTDLFKHFSQLSRKVADRSGIYRIDDSGIANQKYTGCPL